MNHKTLFISGWTGTQTIFSTLSQKTEFIVPFIDANEDNIIDRIKHSNCKTISGWSTGAHMILKHIQHIPSSVERIALFSPFQKFTDIVPPVILKRMIRRIHKTPGKVVEDFHKSCNINPLPAQQQWDIEKLISGLQFLLTSEFQIGTMPNIPIDMIHGTEDEVVPYSFAKSMLQELSNTTLHTLNTGHYIDDKKVLNFLNESIC